jgi:hypothetical protein
MIRVRLQAADDHRTVTAVARQSASFVIDDRIGGLCPDSSCSGSEFAAQPTTRAGTDSAMTRIGQSGRGQDHGLRLAAGLGLARRRSKAESKSRADGRRRRTPTVT